MKMPKPNSSWARLALALGLLLNALALCAAPPHLEPLLQGKWPGFTRGEALDVKVAGNRAYLALGYGGLVILDVSNPASPVWLGGYDTGGYALGVAVSGNHIFVADDERGLKVFCTLPNVQYMMRVDDGTLRTPYTIEAASNLANPGGCLPIFTTNPATLPFEFTDFDVRTAAYPQKFYRVRQP